MNDTMCAMNPYIITSMSREIENWTPWTLALPDGDTSGYTASMVLPGDTSGYIASMADAVWWDSATPHDQRVWTQTDAEELLRHARDYFDQVIARASEEDRQTSAFRRWHTRFQDGMTDLQRKIDGEHWDVGPFAQ